MVSVSYYFFLLATNISTISTPSFEQGVFQMHLGDMPRMKCRCPYSASAMIGHAHSVERLYPAVGKHELQSSPFAKRLNPNSALAMNGQALP